MEYKYEGHSLKSGIYKITNKLNGKYYIGKHQTKNLAKTRELKKV